MNATGQFTTAEEARLLSALVQAATGLCLLCERRAKVGALWFPSEEYQAKVGAPAGKLRVIPYGLCGRCLKKPGHERRAEARIVAHVQAGVRLEAQARQPLAN